MKLEEEFGFKIRNSKLKFNIQNRIPKFIIKIRNSKLNQNSEIQYGRQNAHFGCISNLFRVIFDSIIIGTLLSNICLLVMINNKVN